MNKHLPNSLRALFLSFAVLLSLPMLAVKVEIDGINYDLDLEVKQATVVSKSGRYSGEVVIPESVEHEGAAYSVTSIGDWAFQYCDGLTSVTIPNSVTSIGDDAFFYCSGLTSVHISDIAAWCNIDFAYDDSNPLSYAHHLYLNGEEVKDLVIPNSVTSIGDWAFYKCSGLTSVTIPNSVTSIGQHAFDWCSGLTSVTIPNSVTSIGDYAFRDCDGLTSVHISDIAAWCNIDFDAYNSNPLDYAHHLYLNGEEVKDLVIPNSVTSIGDWAFYGCSGLTSVTIPNSVMSIGDYAFEDCSGLTSVHISDIAAWCNIDFGHDSSNPLSYAHHLYLNGEEVKDLVIPNSVTSIGGGAFRGCSGLTSVTIGNSVTNIGYEAFEGCSGLTSVTIGNSVTSIEGGAFRACSGLTSVTIPNSVTSSIGRYAFEGCSGLTSVTIGSGVTSIESFAFEGCSGLTSVTIGNSVTSIGVYAFRGCNGLTSVHISDIAAWCNIDFDGTDSNPLSYAHHLYLNGEEVKDLVIPNSVTSIGVYVFYECSGLTSVTIGNSVMSIGHSAFYNCSGLTSVTIGNSVTSIGEYAFIGCTGLTSVTIGSGVKSIGKWAFFACLKLLDVYCYAEKVPSTESDAFNGYYLQNATLHVPAASVDSYRATAPWSSFGKIVALTEDETGIDELKGENGKVKTALYDLSGRRVQKGQKGIFIRDGKVVVK